MYFYEQTALIIKAHEEKKETQIVLDVLINRVLVKAYFKSLFFFSQWALKMITTCNLTMKIYFG